jgi:cell division protein ZapA
MSQVVHVDIHGQRYAVRSDLDPHYIGELAVALDEKMRRAACELASADPLKIAILAALNLSDELHRARLAATGAEGHARDRALEIERIVDAVLEDARERAVNE